MVSSEREPKEVGGIPTVGVFGLVLDIDDD